MATVLAKSLNLAQCRAALGSLRLWHCQAHVACYLNTLLGFLISNLTVFLADSLVEQHNRDPPSVILYAQPTN